MPGRSRTDREVKLNTWVGTYPPYLYLPPGLAVSRFDNAVVALIAGRLVSTLLTIGLIAGAIFMVLDRRHPWISHLGLVLAITPMAVFVGSSLTPNGPEIAAGLCFAAACFRLIRDDPDDPPNGIAWILAGLSALVLATSRDLGPAWLALYGLLVLGLTGPRRLLGIVKRGGLPGVVGAALAVAGLGLALYWLLNHQVSPELDLAQMFDELGEAFNVTKEVARQEVAVFGPLAVVLPAWFYMAWGVLLAALGIGALLAGTWRERLVLSLGALGLVLAPMGVDLLQRANDFGVQGRHVMAFTVGVPLLAGEILRRHADELGWIKRLKPAVWLSIAVALLLGYSWYKNMAFYMARPGDPFPFWNAVSEQPPLGWQFLAAMVVVSMLSFVAYGILVSKRPADEPPPTPAVRPETAEVSGASRSA